jgi:hypothetical protein
MSQPGGASLDGEPPASACAAISTWYPKAARRRARSLSPGRSRVRWSAVLAEPRSSAPPRFTPRQRRFRPLAELATRPLTSPFSRPSADPTSLPDPLSFGPPGPALPPSRQRRWPSPCRDAFHRRVLPPPSTPCACAPCAWDHEEPATGIAARVLVAFATATRLPARFHPLSSGPRTRRGHECQRARPAVLRPGPSAARRLLQPTQPASTTAGPPDPRPECERVEPTCARALRSPHSPASAPRRTGRNPSITSPPKAAPIRSAEASQTDNVPAPSTGSTVDAHGARPKPRPTGERRSPAEVSRARGRTRPKPRTTVVAEQLALPAPPAPGCLAAAGSESATPTRSARTPLVVVTVAPPAGEADVCQARHPWEPCPLRSHRASPTPAKGRSSRAHERPACARPPAVTLQRAPCDVRGGHRSPCVACADTRGAQGRISRSSAKKTEVRCTRGAFHR